MLFKVGAVLPMVLLALMPSIARADPIDYNESTSGDLPSSLPSPRVFDFNLGFNTVSGTLNTSSDPFDWFAFVIAPGSVLNNVYYSIETTLVDGTPSGGSSFDIVAGNVPPTVVLGNQFVGSVLPTPSPFVQEGEAFRGSLPLGQGTYGFIDFPSWAVPATGPGGLSQVYQWTFNVAEEGTPPIPEPPPVLLVGLGLAAVFGGIRRGAQRFAGMSWSPRSRLARRPFAHLVQKEAGLNGPPCE